LWHLDQDQDQDTNNRGGDSGETNETPFDNKGVGSKLEYQWNYKDGGSDKSYSDAISWLIEHQKNDSNQNFYIDVGGNKAFEIDTNERKQWSLIFPHKKDGNRYKRAGKTREMIRTGDENGDHYVPNAHWYHEGKPYPKIISDFIEYCHYRCEKSLPCKFMLGEDQPWCTVDFKSNPMCVQVQGQGKKNLERKKGQCTTTGGDSLIRIFERRQ